MVGTFALLYFGGLTLNTMTFGGLALGVGMVVDAAIVVLENSFRHMEHHGKDRMTASIDGSEEVWSAILASILTHIAVFVPLLFLEGVSSVMFRQLSIVVVFSLAMSLFVAVTLVPVLCSRLLVLPPPADQRSGIGAKLYGMSERMLEGMDDGYKKILHLALAHRPTVIGLSAASIVGGGAALSAVVDRVLDADRRGPGPGEHRAAPRHAHRGHRRRCSTGSSRWSGSSSPKRPT